jgi:hypothetical protein
MEHIFNSSTVLGNPELWIESERLLTILQFVFPFRSIQLYKQHLSEKYQV